MNDEKYKICSANWSEKNIDYLLFSGVGTNEHLNSKFLKKDIPKK